MQPTKFKQQLTVSLDFKSTAGCVRIVMHIQKGKRGKQCFFFQYIVVYASVFSEVLNMVAGVLEQAEQLDTRALQGLRGLAAIQIMVSTYTKKI